ncbi:hypothetical protein [Marinobacter sp. F3R08]|uniref:hypothetical protein n=1 Tax=Marinobacter sp. F3R08 TaxID=2841559 RepID=UPI001C0871B3|nr:hypothetical protein [Marinobacter sp. F3R08]MBU2952188.1 hypothetical protein [Marinobacter sp. F3R08]
MNQVALIEVPIQENITALGLFVNGHQVMVTGRSSGHDVMPTRHVAEDIAQALGVTLTTLIAPIKEYGDEWCWNEIHVDMINNGHLMPPEGSTDLMKGFYRCPSCFEQWGVCDTTNESMLCETCDHGLVEPFYSGDPSATVEDTLHSLADQEQKFPNPGERGPYVVEVCRNATKHATLTVDNAAGPASAHLWALETAGDIEFGSDSSAEYEVLHCHALAKPAVQVLNHDISGANEPFGK